MAFALGGWGPVIPVSAPFNPGNFARASPLQMAEFGSEQGLNDFETTGMVHYSDNSAIASLRAQNSQNAALGLKMPFVGGPME